jgi:hypothetical protein
LAGVVGRLCFDVDAIIDGITSCSLTELAETREQIIFNFTKWKDNYRERHHKTLDEIELKVFECLVLSSKDYLLHASGLVKGIDLQGDMQDLAIYTLFLDIRIEVISVDEIHADSTDAQLLLACRPATFPEECFKRRVVCAVLSKNHFDIGVLFRPEVQAVFDLGPDWDRAKTLILRFLRGTKVNPLPKMKWVGPAVRPLRPPPHIPLLTALHASAGSAYASTGGVIVSVRETFAAVDPKRIGTHFCCPFYKDVHSRHSR